MQDVADSVWNKAKNWVATLPAPRLETREDVRWRVVSMQGVGLSVNQRYADGRQVTDDLGVEPGKLQLIMGLWVVHCRYHFAGSFRIAVHAEYIQVPEADVCDILALVQL